MRHPHSPVHSRSHTIRHTVPAAFSLAAVLGLSAVAGIVSASPAAADEPLVAAAAPTTVTPGIAAMRAELIASDAQSAVDAAWNAVAEANAANAEAAASGLDLGDAATSVDVTPLQQRLDRIGAVDSRPVMTLDTSTTSVAASTQQVQAATAQLRQSIADATARAEAASAAQAAEQARLAAASATPAAQSSSDAAPASSGSGDNSVAGAKATARAMLAARGWGDDQFSCLEALWNKESGWNYQAMNRSSGAYGIPQAMPGSKMASAGSDWQTNAATQISWGLGYVSGRYGTPCGAWATSQAQGWY